MIIFYVGSILGGGGGEGEYGDIVVDEYASYNLLNFHLSL